MNIGCTLFYQTMNIISYADDMVLAAPSAHALQILINIFTCKIKNLCLAVNAKKSLYVIFKCSRCKNYNYTNNMYIDGQELQNVTECKYLGIILHSSLSLSSDIKRVNDQFLSQFLIYIENSLTEILMYKDFFLNRTVLASTEVNYGIIEEVV